MPYRNDFMVNYVAPRLGIRTYNIGQDKQLVAAREHWPETMRQFREGEIDSGFADRVLLLLAGRDADAVVLPYIDMLWQRTHRTSGISSALAPIVLTCKRRVS